MTSPFAGFGDSDINGGGDDSDHYGNSSFMHGGGFSETFDDFKYKWWDNNTTIRYVTYAVVVLIICWIIYKFLFTEHFSPRLGFFNPKQYYPSTFVGDDGNKLKQFQKHMIGRGKPIKN